MDNAASRAQVEPLLCPDSCLLLVTSRTRFTLPGLKALNLDALPLEEAVELVCRIAPRLRAEPRPPLNPPRTPPEDGRHGGEAEAALARERRPDGAAPRAQPVAPSPRRTDGGDEEGAALRLAAAVRLPAAGLAPGGERAGGAGGPGGGGAPGAAARDAGAVGGGRELAAGEL